ncbi:MAG: hypothetical protein U0821_26975 [Chloroflexota bacterium]
MAETPDFIPILLLNALEYCPRRYYELVLGEMLVNEHVLEGRMRRERVDEGVSAAASPGISSCAACICSPISSASSDSLTSSRSQAMGSAPSNTRRDARRTLGS